MKLCLIISFLLSNMAIGGCKKQDSGAPEIANPAAVTNLNKTLILQMVNEVRTSGCNCGSITMPPVAAVQWNSLLETAAINHSRDMNDNNYFSHTNLNDASPGERITATGYTWRTYGENIAKGAPDERTVVDGWLQSEPHCRNIMNGNFAEMGIGRAGSYWTQVFATK